MNRNMNNIIHKINEYIPNEKIKFERNKLNNNIEVYLVNHNSMF